MKHTISLALLLIAGINISGAQQPVPASPQAKTIILLGGTAHLGNGQVIPNSIISMENGRITVCDDASKVRVDRTNAEVIDVTGKHVYPGFIAPNTTLGLSEIEAVRATRDFTETGAMNPHVRSLIAYNTDSKVTGTLRTNGILYAQPVPQGGVISGQSSVVELDAWNWEDAAYKTDIGIHLNWPRMYTQRGWWAEPENDERNDAVQQRIEEIRLLFKEAKAYSAEAKPIEKNLRLEAMKGLFDGSKKLFVHASYIRELIAAINFAKEFGVKLVLVGGRDSWMITDLLKENNVAVMLGETHALPSREDEDIDLPFRLPALLQKAGVQFCLSADGFWQQRNLPFMAGTAAAYGLSKEEALMSITSSTARILGVDKTTGTLETGKDATLFVSAGDALDMRTNTIEHAFIRGKKLDLNNVQKGLYEKYKTKYGLK